MRVTEAKVDLQKLLDKMTAEERSEVLQQIKDDEEPDSKNRKTGNEDGEIDLVSPEANGHGETTESTPGVEDPEKMTYYRIQINRVSGGVVISSSRRAKD